MNSVIVGQVFNQRRGLNGHRLVPPAANERVRFRSLFVFGSADHGGSAFLFAGSGGYRGGCVSSAIGRRSRGAPYAVATAAPRRRRERRGFSTETDQRVQIVIDGKLVKVRDPKPKISKQSAA